MKNYRNETLINKNTIKKTAEDICGIFKSQNVKSLKGRTRKCGGPRVIHLFKI